VTGGAGFVGSHLTETLAKNGHEVIVIDDLSNGTVDNIKGLDINFLRLDISKPFSEIIFKKFPNLKVKAIFHLACFPRSMSFANPLRDVDVNVKGMINVIYIAKKIKCKVIFSSNSGIYGSHEKLPINESYPDNPSTPYDIDKLAAEHYLRIYSREFGFPVTIFRFATVYGSRQKISPQWKPVVAEFVCKMLEGVPPTIEGNGEQTRDFIHVSDVVDALLKSVDTQTDLTPIILSSNKMLSINQLYATIARILKFDKAPNKAPEKIGDIKRMCYDNSKAKKLLNWTPQTDLESSLINDVIPYYRNLLQKRKARNHRKLTKNT
jgi:UDP-glucose 4-epimerase